MCPSLFSFTSLTHTHRFGGGYTPNSAQRERIPTEGVLVLSVKAKGPADLAGLQPTRREIWGELVLGDVIVGVNGKRVREQKDLFSALDLSRVGDVMEVRLNRAGVERSVRVKVADRDAISAFE